MPRSSNRSSLEQPFVYAEDSSTIQSTLDEFRRRQQEDLKRYDQGYTTSIRRRPLRKQDSNGGHRDDSVPSQSAESDGWGSDEETWRDSEGDRLDDFGVDEDAEFYDEDDMPLAELLRRRQERTDNDDDD